MDRKTKDYDPQKIKSLVKKSDLFFTERTNVSWGAFSIINAELLLLKSACQRRKYMFYHLLSGEDLPLKTNSQIYDFFSRHKGREFVSFVSEDYRFEKRVYYRYRLQEYVGRVEKNSFFNRLQDKDIKRQIRHKILRNTNVPFQMGCNWFSIGDELARYVIGKEDWIKRIFYQTQCGDEIFLHTVFFNSPYIKNIYSDVRDSTGSGVMRLVDWQRGSPYVYTTKDLPELLGSDRMFARKFQAEVDIQVIREIYKKLSESE